MRSPYRHLLLFASALTVVTLVTSGCSPRNEDEALDRIRADNAIEDGRFELARTYLEQHLQNHPDDVTALRQLCIAWRRGVNQALVPSLEAMQRYLELAPNDEEIRRLFIESQLMLGSHDEAVAASALLPDTPTGNMLRARAALEVDPTAARAAVDRSLAVDPDDPAARLIAADVARRSGDLEVERRHLERVVDLSPLDDKAWYRLGRSHLLAGEAERGRFELDVARRLVEFHEAEAMRPPNAAVVARAFAAVSPDIPADAPTVLVTRFRLALASGRVDEGLRHLETLETAGALTFDQEVELVLQLAGSARSVEAISRLERLLDRRPSSRSTRLGLVRLLRATGQAPEAEAVARRGLEIEPGAAHLQAELARLALADGREDEADRSLARALELAPWAAGWRIERARLALGRGSRSTAATILDEAPEPSPTIDRFRGQHGLDGG